jgi:hypothetical protein
VNRAGFVNLPCFAAGVGTLEGLALRLQGAPKGEGWKVGWVTIMICHAERSEASLLRNKRLFATHRVTRIKWYHRNMDKENREKLRERFLRDPLPRRLGGLAATLGRISSSARNSTDPDHVSNLLDEAKHLIEWTAADTEPETAAELVQMQTMITLWQRAWTDASQNPQQRLLLSVQVKDWLDEAVDFSGLV